MGEDPVAARVLLPTGTWWIYGAPLNGWPRAAPGIFGRLSRGLAGTLLMATAVAALVGLTLRYRHSERALQQMIQEAKKTQRAVENATDAYFFARPDGSLAFINQQAEDYLDLDRSRLLSSSVSEFIDLSRKGGWDTLWADVSNRGQAAFETVLQRRDGSSFECEVRAWHIDFEEESLVIISVRDLTPAKRIENLRNVLFEQSTDAHLIFDESGIIECNQAAVEMLRMASKEELMSKHPAVFSPELQPDGRKSMEKRLDMDAIAREKGFHRFDWMHQRKNGRGVSV